MPLGDHEALATIAVKDLKKVRTFYEDTLGLKKVSPNEEGGIVYKSGSSQILVYESQYAGTNQATAATWNVKDVDAIVKELKAKGVTFEHYDLPETKREGDVHVSGPMRIAWCKDPDGNILAIAQGEM